MDIQKEREAFNKEFGIDDADTFPAFSGGIENSAALKCNWLGWKKRAELEYRENPETIEIDGLKTIHKLCKFADEHNMEGCTFTEIVERMFAELAKSQAVPEGFVLVSEDKISHFYQDNDEPENFCNSSNDWDCLGDGIEKDQIMIVNKHTQANISTEKFYGAWKLIETSYGARWKFELFKSESEAKQAMIEAQEQSHDSQNP